jgi:hypothetical protein
MANYPDKKGYLLKYDARFNKIYEKELSPVGGPYDDYIFGQVFVGEDENVYITLWCKKNIGYDVLTIEVQKISSNGELVWARILPETITGFSHGIWYYVRNIREVSGKVFVGIQKFNQTYSGGWITRNKVLYLHLMVGLVLYYGNLAFQKLSKFINGHGFVLTLTCLIIGFLHFIIEYILKGK